MSDLIPEDSNSRDQRSLRQSGFLLATITWSSEGEEIISADAMVSVRDLFEAAGPSHLTSVNWTCPHHRRSVAASLVQGAYVLERDRQRNRQGPEARAPAWWEFFSFKLVEQLVDTADSSIFGAIYQFTPRFDTRNLTATAPEYVIAFRGTITKKGSFSQDLKLDLRFLDHSLPQTARFETAMQAVRKLLASTGHMRIWLAGHSLGSAIAMLAGKNTVKSGIYLETFLFNPPFVAVPIERIKDRKVKHGIRIAGSLVTAGLTLAVKGQRGKSEEYFAVLSSWVPHLFVNRADHICSEYVAYFEHRRRMEKIGAGGIERLATQNSIWNLFMSAAGKETEPLHLIPSAELTVNLSHSPDFKTAHGIHQWWRPDLHLQSREYLFR